MHDFQPSLQINPLLYNIIMREITTFQKASLLGMHGNLQIEKTINYDCCFCKEIGYFLTSCKNYVFFCLFQKCISNALNHHCICPVLCLQYVQVQAPNLIPDITGKINKLLLQSYSDAYFKIQSTSICLNHYIAIITVNAYSHTMTEVITIRYCTSSFERVLFWQSAIFC